MDTHFDHIPVLLAEVCDYLNPASGERILDCTLGLGGHSKALMERANGDCALVGLDADAENLERAKTNLSQRDPFGANCKLLHKNFQNLPILNLGAFDIILADLGISSVHLDDPQKGFSFRFDGPLDMRLNQKEGRTAAELIAEESTESLTKILWEYGEIRQSKKIAEVLKDSEPKTTKQALACIEQVAGFRTPSIAPQVFQALRIAVNDELGALRTLLDIAPQMLNAGGRLGIISFHSLEDRMVKQHFRTLTSAERDEHTGQDLYVPPFELLTRKAVKPTDEEVTRNPRARSARLRVIRKRIASDKLLTANC